MYYCVQQNSGKESEQERKETHDISAKDKRVGSKQERREGRVREECASTRETRFRGDNRLKLVLLVRNVKTGHSDKDKEREEKYERVPRLDCHTVGVRKMT